MTIEQIEKAEEFLDCINDCDAILRYIDRVKPKIDIITGGWSSARIRGNLSAKDKLDKLEEHIRYIIIETYKDIHEQFTDELAKL